MGFYIAINRDKQRQNTVLSFPDDEVIRQIISHFMRVSRLSKKKVQQEYSKIVLDNARKYSIIPSR